MANRAYLYFTDDISALTNSHFRKRPDGSERMYMDSRHQFPLAWKLFFRPQDVLLVPNSEYNWNDLYLAREWEAAKAEFLRRLPLLLNWFPEQLSHTEIEIFFGWLETLVANAGEKFLVVDPHELEIEGEHEPEMRAALDALGDAKLTADEKFEYLDRWSGGKYPWNFLGPLDHILGFYYGGYFER